MRLRPGVLALTLRLAVLALVGASLLLPRPEAVHAVAANVITSPDTADQTGRGSSLRLDANGDPVVSYYEVTNGDLKVLHCNDPDCSGGDESIAAPDTADNVGSETSLALDASGYPVISYWDATNNDLKVLHCNDPNCVGSNESIVSPDTTAVGRYSSLELDASGNPVVSYHDTTNLDLKLLHCNDANCTGGDESITAPDTAAEVGQFTSLTLDGSGYPVVTYYDTTNTNQDLKVLHCNDPNCVGNDESITAPDTAGAVGHDTSLALDASGNPVVSYHDVTNADLKVLHCNDANCAAGGDSITSPDTGVVGGDTSLALDPSGKPVIAYTGPSVVKLLRCNDPNCGGGNDSITTPGPGPVSVGFYLSLALDTSGNPVVSYPGVGADEDLKLLHCGNPNCYTSGFSLYISPVSTAAEEATSLELDSAGNPVVAYDAFGDLAVFHCGDPACSSGNSTTTPDAAGSVGSFASLALDSAGYPVVAYYDDTNDDLKLIHCDDVNCAGDESLSITSPDTTNDVGWYASLALDGSGNPVVVYYDRTGGNLKLMHCNDANCTGGDESITSPDTTNDVGQYASLALDGTGYPVIAYYDATNSDLKVMHCNDTNCSGGDESIASPDTSGSVGGFASLALDANGSPVVSYSTYTPYITVKVLHCGNANCTAGNYIAVPYAGDGFFTSILLDGAGNPVVSFGDILPFAGLIVIHCGNPTCSGSNTIATPAPTGGTGIATSVELDPLGNPVVSFVGDAGFELGVLHCGDPTCKGAAAPTPLVVLTGDGTPGDCASGTSSQACRVNQPAGMHLADPDPGAAGVQAASAAGSAVYYADTGNNKVKKIVPAPPKGSGTTYDVAGSGSAGSGGDGGLATSAQLNHPRDVFVTGDGAYIADTDSCRIRRVNFTTDTISTVAGTGTCGFTGEGGMATSARLNHPTGLAVDAVTGDLYIADRDNQRVRKVLAGGDGFVSGAGDELIVTVAGTGTAGYSGDSGLGTAAKLNQPSDVFFLLPGEDLLIADTANNRIRRLDLPAGIISTFAGTGTAGYSGDGGLATSATLSGPTAIAVLDYRVAIADTANDVVRVVNALTGEIETTAGGLATTQPLDSPKGVVVVPDGSLVIANTDAATIVTAGVDLEGDRTTNFRPTQSCTMLPTISSIDWALPALLLGGIATRRRLGALFALLLRTPGLEASGSS